MVAQNRSAGRTHGGQVLFDAQRIFADQGIGGCQDLRRRTVILHHQNGLYLRESLVEIKQIADVCTAPCVDGLIRITDDEQILVVPHQNMHQLILERVDILEFVDHNVFQAFLPFQPDLFLLFKDIEGKFDQIVVIEAEALLFLIEIAVKNDVGHFGGLKVFVPQCIKWHLDHFQIVIGIPDELVHLDHIAGLSECHIAQSQTTFFIDDLQHVVDIGVVEHKEAFRIRDGVAVLLQDRDTEAVECVDIPGVVITGEPVNAPLHLICGFVGEGDTENVARQNAKFVDEISETCGECARFAGPGTCDDADEPLCGGDGIQLRWIQAV